MGPGARPGGRGVSEWIGRFVAMGGDGAYVWSAYGITAVVLIANAVQPLRRERTLLARERRQRP